MKKLFLIALSMCFLASNAFAGGCLPGDPCYKKPMKKAQPKMHKPMVMADPTTSMYVSVGAGYNVLEKDQEILGHHNFDVRVGGYRFADRLSAEVGFGFAPDVRSRKFPGAGRFALADDTSLIRFFGDVMFHCDEEASDIDPYLALGLGVNLYADRTSEGDSAMYLQGGIGTFVNLDESWFVKPDYRVQMVGEHTEVNHLFSVSLGYRFDI